MTRRPYFLIPALALLLLAVGFLAPTNQIAFGLLWGLVFTILAVVLVYCYWQIQPVLPSVTEDAP